LQTMHSSEEFVDDAFAVYQRTRVYFVELGERSVP
jgi:hypothetical protein